MNEPKAKVSYAYNTPRGTRVIILNQPAPAARKAQELDLRHCGGNPNSKSRINARAEALRDLDRRAGVPSPLRSISAQGIGGLEFIILNAAAGNLRLGAVVGGVGEESELPEALKDAAKAAVNEYDAEVRAYEEAQAAKRAEEAGILKAKKEAEEAAKATPKPVYQHVWNGVERGTDLCGTKPKRVGVMTLDASYRAACRQVIEQYGMPIEWGKHSVIECDVDPETRKYLEAGGTPVLLVSDAV